MTSPVSVASARSLTHVDDFALRILLQAIETLLTSDAGLFRAAEGHVDREFQMLVHPYGAAVDPHRNVDSALEIVGPDRAPQAVFGCVGTVDHLVDAVVGEDRDDGAELLLLNQARLIREVAHHRRGDEEARAV